MRDITVQWKAMGSMVGSWNMLVYGTGFYVMKQIKKLSPWIHAFTAADFWVFVEIILISLPLLKYIFLNTYIMINIKTKCDIYHKSNLYNTYF